MVIQQLHISGYVSFPDELAAVVGSKPKLAEPIPYNGAQPLPVDGDGLLGELPSDYFVIPPNGINYTAQINLTRVPFYERLEGDEALLDDTFSEVLQRYAHVALFVFSTVNSGS